MIMQNPQTHRSEIGSALVELAVTMPVLVTILMGAADFGRVFYRAMELTTAARAGAQDGARSVARTSTQMKAAAVAASPEIGLATADITVAEQRCQCASDDGSSLAAPTKATCDNWAAAPSQCTASGQHKVYFAVVTASKSFSLVSSYVPGVPNPLSVSRTAWQRIQ